ncbi:MAG TPA: cation transporter [Bacteroidales bacterium]|nr:cation transporter [Bacteroidales bacterium]HRZ49899.1 cation transporter [Bacteroidales bacterium]
MRKLLIVALLAVILAPACRNQQTQEPENLQEAIDSTRLVTIRYSVEGMTCTGCENTINQAVTEIEGVTQAKSSHLEKYTEVTYDTALVQTDMIEKAINGKGYEFKGLYQPE